MKKFLFAGGALILFGAGCVAGTKIKSPSAVGTPPSVVALAAAPTSTVQNSIIVKDQKAGDEAMIEMVSLVKKGYVVVHEDNNGMVGKIVGTSTLLNVGETKSITFKMKIHPGLSHWAMLHVDNGDGVFDENLDLPLRNDKGEFIMQAFKGEGEAMKKETKKME